VPRSPERHRRYAIYDIKDPAPEAGGQQHTGNHPAPNAPDSKGADRFGGTRAGAENVEKPTNIEKGTDVDRVAGVEQQLDDDSRNPNGPTLRTAERDERGRI
jgi:hypothetical protein